MKVNCYRDSTLSENHVDIYCREKDREIERIIRYIHSNSIITGRNDEMYLESDVYRIDFSLSGFLERFSSNGFVQVSKSMAVNVYHIRQFKTDLNMKMTLYLENGEAVILNRAYKKKFMECLKQLQEGVL